MIENTSFLSHAEVMHRYGAENILSYLVLGGSFEKALLESLAK
jgi:hypothetical protein